MKNTKRMDISWNTMADLEVQSYEILNHMFHAKVHMDCRFPYEILYVIRFLQDIYLQQQIFQQNLVGNYNMIIISFFLISYEISYGISCEITYEITWEVEMIKVIDPWNWM